MSKLWRYLLIILLLITITTWLAVLTSENNNFKIIACDVGQGDAILAVYGQTEILIDGGPNNKVLDCLSRHMPFWDRKIEAVMMTHPEKDHYYGLIDVFKSYDVSYFITSGLDSVSQDYQVLKREVGSSGATVLRVRSDQSIRIGLMHLDILHPSEEYIAGNSSENSAQVLGAFTTLKNKNDFSIVAGLSFGEFDALLTGDIEDNVSDMIAGELTLRTKREWEYIKVPHHGSKNGLSQKLLDVVNPKLAIISSGKNNSYGHQHEEVLKLFIDKNIKILRTDERGDVAVETDGKSYWLIKLINR